MNYLPRIYIASKFQINIFLNKKVLHFFSNVSAFFMSTAREPIFFVKVFPGLLHMPSKFYKDWTRNIKVVTLLICKKHQLFQFASDWPENTSIMRKLTWPKPSQLINFKTLKLQSVIITFEPHVRFCWNLVRWRKSETGGFQNVDTSRGGNCPSLTALLKLRR